jgi:hypothetical protein
MRSPDASIADRPARQLSSEALQALERAVVRFKTQVAVAKQLGRSAATVNQALKGKYRGDVADLEQRIRGVLLNLTVECPVLREISTKVCLDEQSRPLVFSNPMRVRLHRACKTCPHRKDATTHKGAPYDE